MQAVWRSVLLLFALVCSSAQAQLSIEITGGGANQIPIGVLRFAGEQVLPQSISDIVEADLQRSGRFRMLFAGSVNPLPTEMSQVNFTDWRNRTADAIVIGSVVRLADGRFEASFRLLDVPKQAQIGGVAFTLSAQQVRTTAHRIADIVYEKLTGDRGVFSTRIAYVVKQGSRYELQIADADGIGAQTALASREPIISPACRQTEPASPMSRSRTRNRWSMCIRWSRGNAGQWRISRGPTVRLPGPPMANNSPWCCPRTAVRRST